MKKKSIFKQLLVPMVTIVCVLAAVLSGVIVIVSANSYESGIYEENTNKSRLMAGEIATFMDGAYGVTEELAVNPSILTMDTKIQTPILEDCVSRNSYLELLYIQGMDGMQTGRSSGELADRSTRWWFIQMMEQKEAFVSKSYYSVNTGMPCASIFFPMYDEESMVGIFAVDLKLDYLQGLIEEFSNMDEGEFSFVIDGEGVVVAHPDSTQIEELYNYKTLTKTVSSKDEQGNPLTDNQGNILTQEQAFEISEDYQNIITEVMGGNTGSGKLREDGVSYYVSYTTIPLKGASDSWSIITLQKEASAMSMIRHIVLISVVVALLAISAAAFIITLLARRLTKPIVSITSLIGDASDGDFTRKADESSKNELGVLSRSFNKMIGKLSHILTKMATITREVVLSSQHLKGIEENVDSISKAVREISEGSSAQSEDVARVVMRTAELEEDFQQLKEKSGLLLDEAQNTSASGEGGRQKVKELRQRNELITERMGDAYKKIIMLEAQSGKISNIVSTINEISSQTELLALNASIEAARAGEKGRGFAVVAESIGKLAADSTAATTDIETIIVELCRDIAETVSNIEEIKSGIQDQTEIVDRVQGAFSDFNELADQTRSSVGEIEELVVKMHKSERSIVHAIDRIHEISGNTSDLSEKVADALEEQLEGIRHMRGRIDDLSVVSAEMEQEMTKFKI